MIIMNADTTAYINAKFQKIRRLRFSGKGEVWLASDTSGKLFVIKHVFMTGLPYKTLKEHPQPIAPRIIYCVENDDDTFVVEEYVQGDSLLERLEQKRYLTEQETEQILLSLCDGLAPLHKMGIIHRDIKPSNLILQNGNIIRVIDFDAARIVKSDTNEDTRLLGTKGYAPPEQFGYGQTDERSDIYAIGITMKKMLGSGYHGYLTKILDKCTEIDPKKRYATVISLKQAVLWNRRNPLKIVTFLGVSLILIALFCTTTQWISAPWPVPEESPVTDEIAVPIKPETKTESPAPSSTEKKLPETAVPSVQEMPVPAKSESIVSDVKNQEEAVPTEFPAVEERISLPQHESRHTPEKPIGTSLSLNGIAADAGQTDLIYLDRADWSSCFVNLHVENNTNSTWESPGIRVVFSDNFGRNHSETISLPSINSGSSADFEIPVGSYPVTDNPEFPEVSAWLQLYLDHGNLPVSEKYWCLQFCLKDTSKTVYREKGGS